MTEQQFWQLVTLTIPIETSEDACDILKKQLIKLNDDELKLFDKLFTLTMRKAFSWQLWGAAYVIAGCNSEYDFVEFRCWLMAQGKEHFAAAIANPESLINLTMPMKDGLPCPYIDEYDLVAGFVFEQRNETELPYFPAASELPQGKRFKDKAKYLKQTYPKLFEKYWKK